MIIKMVEAQKDEKTENRGERIYVLQILIPNGCYLRSNADIPKLSEIAYEVI